MARSLWVRGVVALVLAGCVAGAARAGDDAEVPLPAPLQAQLFVKILSFDRRLPGRAGKDVVFGIVVQRGYRASLDAAEDLFAAVEDLPPPSPSEPRLRPVLVDLDGAELGALVDELGVEVLYVTPLRAVTMRDVCAVSRARSVTTVTGVPAYVREGLAMGVGVRDERPEILVNLAAARAEGAELSSQLLDIARVIR